MAHDVFVSYSAKDKPTADAVVATLEVRGIRCWIAPRDVLAGMHYGEAIIDAINASKAMVLVFSKNANESSQIRLEVERAVSKGISIIPVRIEDVAPGKSLEYFIGPVHWLDALTPPLERHLEQLASTIQVLLRRTAAATGEEVVTPPSPPTVPVPPIGATATIPGAAMAAPVAPVRPTVPRIPGMPLATGAGLLEQAAREAAGLVMSALKSGSAEQRRVRLNVALAAGLGAGSAAVLHNGIFTVFRRNWLWVALPVILAGLVTYAWAYGAQQRPSRAAKIGVIVGLVAGSILTVVMIWITRPRILTMGRWVSAEALIWAIFGLLGGLAIDRLRRTRFGPPVLTGLASGALATILLIWLMYREFTTFTLMVALGWAAGLIFVPPPETAPGPRANAGQGHVVDTTLST
ncbi:MAG: TIR domain-containing protein [Armatimonadota bacterium]